MTLSISELSQRSLDIFRKLVDAYVETGEPVGSRTLSKKLDTKLSPATIRNVMADLEEAGLLYAPHTSAGRLPTDEGLRFFVHSLLEFGELKESDRATLEEGCQAQGKDFKSVLEEATTTLSGLSHCAGVILAPKSEAEITHFEFVSLGHGRAIAILVTSDGIVENRIVNLPDEILTSSLVEATNFLNAYLVGKTLREAKDIIEAQLRTQQAQLNQLTKKVVEDGLAMWAGGGQQGSLIVRGQANLLSGVTEVADLEHIRNLLNNLEAKENISHLLDASIQAEGIQIFIGSENNLFDLSGCSMVISPYKNSQEKVIGAIGVIGPVRMDYSKIIPMVNYTAKMISRFVGKE